MQNSTYKWEVANDKKNSEAFSDEWIKNNINDPTNEWVCPTFYMCKDQANFKMPIIPLKNTEFHEK